LLVGCTLRCCWLPVSPYPNLDVMILGNILSDARKGVTQKPAVGVAGYPLMFAIG
jgi:hypothetical protein